MLLLLSFVFCYSNIYNHDPTPTHFTTLLAIVIVSFTALTRGMFMIVAMIFAASDFSAGTFSHTICEPLELDQFEQC